MSRSLRLVVLGTAASNPYAGMAWMHMQIAAGFLRLGHDVHYLETTRNWPYDPVRREKLPDSTYAVDYLAALAGRFGLGDRWAYRRSFSDGAWLGPSAVVTLDLLASADAVFNVAGSTRLDKDGLSAGNLVYLGTDPVIHEVGYENGDEEARGIVDQHDAVVTYGENIGTPASPVPALPGLKARTRQPVLLDLWPLEPVPKGAAYTTVANWKQEGREVQFRGERYLWSKDVEFRRVMDVPTRVPPSIELATNLAPPESMHYGEGEPVKARGVVQDTRAALEANRWRLVDAQSFTLDPWSYRDYIVASRGEFGVARDLNVRLCTGWFSERSACYLAAGRPVVTQDTGFGTVLPTGEGLFAFRTADEAAAAIESIEADYERHSRAAREIAEQYFAAEIVLTRLLEDLGL
jgi:hypothetical protein